MTDVFDAYPMPPCAQLLGWQLLERDTQDGRVKLSFDATGQFLNGSGNVQGGFLAAMLDDTMGPAVLVASNGTRFISTIDMHVAYLAPAWPGRLYAEGRAVRLGKTVGFVEAVLTDGAGTALARAVSSGRLVSIDRFPS